MHVTVDDLTQLERLDPYSVKKCLQSRYYEKSIYTWAGPTLVALNPLRELVQLYSANMVQLYAHEPSAISRPHIFAIAQRALQHLQWSLGKIDQAIVVNGESGAGKTRSALHLLSYLAAMEANNNEMDRPRNIEVLLCKFNPLLEAMGNSRTSRNDNSSRFGKLIRLSYVGEGDSTELASAHIETYLLESTRVARQAPGERNFHIFYQMLVGLPDALQEELRLKLASTWRIATPSPGTEDDRIAFHKTLCALNHLERQQGGQDTVRKLWQLLAAILHLGNVDFARRGDEDKWATNQTSHLQAAAELLGLSERALWHLLTRRRLQAGANVVVQPCRAGAECATRRDTLLKLLYRLAFDSILQSINETLRGTQQPPSSGACKHLNILDLYGFESFEHGNSLEQLCINYANERLQFYFTVNYLKEQFIHLTNEGISVSNLDSNVNEKEHVIGLLDGAVSVFGVLNEECFLNRGGDDNQVCQRIVDALARSARGAKVVPPPSPRTPRRSAVVEFTVQHYAGPVTYSTRELLDKNRDQVPIEFISVLAKTSNSFVRHLMDQEVLASGGSNSKTGRRHTVLAKFKSSLDNLMKILNSCDVHYVRCIRPSVSAVGYAPSQWDDIYVEAQLNASGVLDTIKVSAFGFPNRMSRDEYMNRYRVLVTGLLPPTGNAEALHQRIIFIWPQVEHEFCIGRRQVYATEHGLQLLEERKMAVRQRAAKAVQRWWRTHLGSRHRAAATIQSWWRRCVHERRLAAVLRIQSWWRQKLLAAETLRRLGHLTHSLAIVRRVLKRWIFVWRLTRSSAAKKLLHSSTSETVTAPMWQPLTPTDDERPSTRRRRHAAPLQTMQPLTLADAARTFTLKRLPPGLALHLPRAIFFYQDGVISVRQPPVARIRFTTKKTCLPYSYVLPKSLMPSGLTDALTLTCN